MLIFRFYLNLLVSTSLIRSFFYFLQEEKGYGYLKLEKHGLNMLIAGPVLWVVGSIHNSCQIYERAGGHVQMLQHTVHIPFLMGSMLFLVGAILNSREQAELAHHGLDLLVSCSPLIQSLVFVPSTRLQVIDVNCFNSHCLDPRLVKLSFATCKHIKCTACCSTNWL